MKRVDYELNTWYPLTDNEYWVEEYPDEFPNCNTIVTCLYQRFGNEIKTYQSCSIGWGTMAKDGCWYFMIIEKPKR
jgi:hypothetical protein